MPKAKTAAATPHSAPYRRLQKRLGQTGWVALGSVMERNKPGQGGPRYQWSRRVAGKTVTVALSKEQFEWLKAAIANQRETTKTLEEMHRLALQHMWKHLPSTSRRKTLSDSTLGVN
jgi:hypothetical protein